MGRSTAPAILFISHNHTSMIGSVSCTAGIRFSTVFVYAFKIQYVVGRHFIGGYAVRRHP